MSDLLTDEQLDEIEGFAATDLVRGLVSDVRRLRDENARLSAEKDALHNTRRNVHLALSKAGVRTHEFIGDNPAFPMGREIGAVERTEMLVAEVLRLRSGDWLEKAVTAADDYFTFDDEQKAALLAIMRQHWDGKA